MRTHEEGKPQLPNMSSMKKTVHFCSVVQWVYWVMDTLKLSPIFGLAKKVLMVLETLLHGEVASIMSSLQRLKISDQKIE